MLNNFWLEIIGWGGNLAFFIGAILTAKANRQLFVWQVLGNLFYGMQACLMINFSLLVLSIVLIGVNIWGWKNWNKK